MTRTALALLAAAGAFLLSGAAQAKAPPDGFDVCGPAACAHMQFDAAEQFWIAAYAPDGATRAAPAPFFVLRWHWAQGEEESAYLIPGALAIRWNAGNGHPSGWSSIDATAAGVVGQVAAGIEPYATPTLTRVTVGGREVQNPESYIRLLTGKRTFAFVKGPWLRITFQSATPSPWTDGSAIVRLSKRQPYVQIDGFLYRLSRADAVRARKGLSLD
jgi:hypothetical protein